MNAYRVPEIAPAVCPHQVRLDRWCPACADADPLHVVEEAGAVTSLCGACGQDVPPSEWSGHVRWHLDVPRLHAVDRSPRVPAGWVAVALLAGLALGLLIGRLA